jgi:glycosyltransferase involved in cell wall biosynthesis
MTPRVSVIVAVKNGERYLAEALHSITVQGYENYEILVVDGGSTDPSLAIARTYPQVVCLEQAGRGYLNAWNTGIGQARGEFLAFLDSDDRWSYDKLWSQLALLETDQSVDYAFGRVRFFLEADCPLPRGFRREVLEGDHAVPFCGSILARRRVLERVGLFDEGLGIAGDIAWTARLRDVCAAAWVDRVVLHKRLHAGNLGHVTAASTFKAELLQVAWQRVQERRRDAARSNAAASPPSD